MMRLKTKMMIENSGDDEYHYDNVDDGDKW